MHQIQTEFPTEIIIAWLVCIVVIIFMVIAWWSKAYKSDDYIESSDDRLLTDLHMLGVNDD